MKERPIQFSAPMVRAILDGSKTQTRRIVKGAQADWTPVAPRVYWPLVVDRHGEERPGSVTYGAGNEDGSDWFPCPYGAPGDRLWVRETWGYFGGDEYLYQQEPASVGYRADHVGDHILGGRWRPSIHMPRWASRIDLAITGVRLERLQDISEADALAEGVNVHPDHHGKPRDSIYSPVQAYRDLWDQINGEGAWAENPWVWVVEFKRVTP